MPPTLAFEKVGKHKQYHARVNRFLDAVIDYMLDNNCSMSVKTASKELGVSLTTIYAWIKELEKTKRVELFEGQIIVSGIVFEDLR